KITPRATTTIPRNLPLRDTKRLVLLTCAKRNPEKSAANCRSWAAKLSQRNEHLARIADQPPVAMIPQFGRAGQQNLLRLIKQAMGLGLR
ncbi:hypothetical protein, partial [Roseovarius amoyensis]|uniref:hypothetical protein n=1 Tax=Roseovarius amoyensis TaxID=2211448 RepID=UPI00195518E6